MKEFVMTAKRVINDRDGFVYGFIRGTLGTGVFISLLTLLTACMG